jgi:hypothetical protein
MDAAVVLPLPEWSLRRREFVVVFEIEKALP